MALSSVFTAGFSFKWTFVSKYLTWWELFFRWSSKYILSKSLDYLIHLPSLHMMKEVLFLQCMKVKSENEVAQSCLTLSNPMDCLKKTTPHLPVNLNGYFMMHFEYFQNICFHKKQRFSLKEWHICINNTPYSITSFFIKTESVRVWYISLLITKSIDNCGIKDYII